MRKTHKVIRGDTVSKIATMYAVGPLDIRRWNHIPDINRIEIGWELFVEEEKGEKSRFDVCVDRVLGHEGGATTEEVRKVDRGGATNFGISEFIFNTMKRDGLTTAEMVDDITEHNAREAYRKYFWIAWRCNTYAPGFDYMVFDIRINFDVNIGTKIIRNCDSLKAMKDRRDCEYHKIVARDPSQKMFLTGWLKRSQEVYEQAVVDRKNNAPA